MRVNRLYLSCLPSFLFFFILFILLFLIFFPRLSTTIHDHPRSVYPTGPQSKFSKSNLPCRTSIPTIRTQVSMPDLNHDHPDPILPCRTSNMTILIQCFPPDLNRNRPHPKFPAGPHPRPSTPNYLYRTSTRTVHAR